ncbi:aminotransferase-like domain-containing protein [Aspergillus fijiensis CBS 313.89]|uniref:PLP-dependent transferase n=1 Tax=Aspergillus fijiensis CBS 313.89 TaxID=1448319 RepID=A0A8G1RUZ4_9EURO|nr:PLP-dependent transferase [Aspergillus fijiensis CBS 313.89]RAK79182.1 PLP-dependent transferase [Aspergillus fijiensis CBS 313.89]
MQPINLQKGSPHPSLLPATQLRSAAATVLSNPSLYIPALDYGDEAGYRPLRANIAQWLTEFYAPARPIPTERICITGGASQNLACILQVFTDPRHTVAVWLPEPTYHLVFTMFRDAGLGDRLRAVPEDGEGMQVGELERGIADAPGCHSSPGCAACGDGGMARGAGTDQTRPGKKFKHLIYCVPTYANPSGATMSVPHREALVRLARRHDALVVCDDVYDFLSVTPGGQSPAPRLVDIDRTLDGGVGHDGLGNVVSNGSFSKILGPGCRVGWAEATPRFVAVLAQCGSNVSGGAPSHLTSTYINQMFENGSLQAHLEKNVLPAILRRYWILADAVRQRLVPLGVSFQPDEARGMAAGGFFLWLRLPAGVSSEDIDREATKQGLVIGKGRLFAVPGRNAGGSRERVDGFIRLCFMWEDEDRLVEGVGRLEMVLRRLLASG